MTKSSINNRKNCWSFNSYAIVTLKLGYVLAVLCSFWGSIYDLGRTQARSGRHSQSLGSLDPFSWFIIQLSSCSYFSNDQKPLFRFDVEKLTQMKGEVFLTQTINNHDDRCLGTGNSHARTRWDIQRNLLWKFILIWDILCIRTILTMVKAFYPCEIVI